MKIIPELKDFKNILFQRTEDSHKGMFGHIGIFGGCTEYSGAVKLSNLAMSSLRCGCGIATLIIPKSIVASVSPYILESTIFPLEDEDGHPVFQEELAGKICKTFDALAIGMGWGTSIGNEEYLKYILEHYEGKLLLDADGLNTLSRIGLSYLDQTKAKVVLTPHPKEMERLSNVPMSKILEYKEEVALQFAKEHHVMTLIKGHTTYVSDGCDVYACTCGCAGMATAGSGDVLSGILVGLLGYNDLNAKTISCGVYIAGMAGSMAEQEAGDISMVASDTIGKISKAIMTIRNA